MAIGNNNQPFFSVVIPTYNRINHLVIALNSILEQDFSDFEVIVIDDGSTDDTKRLLLEMVRNNPRIKYFFKVNEERSIARNYGIIQASWEIC